MSYSASHGINFLPLFQRVSEIFLAPFKIPPESLSRKTEFTPFPASRAPGLHPPVHLVELLQARHQASSGTLNRLGVSIWPQIGCMPLRDFSKETDELLCREGFPYGVYEILAPSARYAKLAI